jgi:UDP-N-acetylmuramyl pentapeptide phosphotransferase/UDP-N-acetylglucosamine-1-phosphate transferase
MLSVAVLVVVVGLLAAVLTRWLIHPDAPIRLLDQPNERSLHTSPTPRTGGIAICVTLFAAWLVLALTTHLQFFPINILLGAVIIAAIAMLDDRHNLSAGLRLLVQISAALVMIYGGFFIQGEVVPGIIFAANTAAMTAMTVLLTLWLINLYNFMDGMDGFAGGMAVIGFGTLSVLGWAQGDILFAGSALTVCAAAAGFLWFNFPPARIFMGDSGSTTLGFLVAAFAIWGSRRGITPVWLSLVIFSPFVVDATVTLLKRALRGEPVWRAHRSHYYQRLVQLGWGHRRTVTVEYAVMLGCAGLAWQMKSANTRTQWVMLCVLAGGYILAAMAIHRRERIGDAGFKT